MRLADHVTLNFNNKMSTTALFLDIEKAFDTTWHPGFSISCRNYIFRPEQLSSLGNFYCNENSVSVEGEMSTPRCIEAGVPQGSILSPTLYNLYINDTPQTIGVNLRSSLCG
jgi:hypothetical protein